MDVLGFGFSASGIGLQFTGRFAFPSGGPTQTVVLVTGTILLAVGLAFLAARKGRSPVFGLLAPMSCVGFLIVFLLRKHCRQCGKVGGIEQAACDACGASM